MTSNGLGIRCEHQIWSKSSSMHDLQDPAREMEKVIATDAFERAEAVSKVGTEDRWRELPTQLWSQVANTSTQTRQITVFEQ
jgi:hypothetical protein